MEILKEITQWDVEYRQPNHTYLVNKKGQIIAYAKWHSNQVMVFKSRTKLDKRYRKFEKVNHKELSQLIPQFKSEDKKESVDIIKPTASVRVFNVLSKGKNYTVTFNTISKTVSCGCTGYGYRRTCSHSKAVAQKVL